jgi:hypothetical protein
VQFELGLLQESHYFGDMPKTPKRPRDMMQLAKLVGEIATGEVADPTPEPDAAAVKRGKARAAKLSPKKRSAIAKKAAAARWKRPRG